MRTPDARTRWAYPLVVVMVLALGAAAGEALAVVRGLGDYQGGRACLTGQGIITVPDGRSASPDTMAKFAQCTTDVLRSFGLTTLAGAVALPLIVLSCTLGGAWIRLGRLRRAGDRHPAARQYFEAWCDSFGLTGRRRPVLLLTADGRPAWTMEFPFRRPVVAIAAAQVDSVRRDFPFIAVHELAHVLARDSAWAAAARWTGFLAVPTLLAAVISLVAYPGDALGLYRTALASAAGLSAAVLVARAALLRRREFVADAVATSVLGPDARTRTFAGRQDKRSSLRWNPFATHPTMAARRAGKVLPGEGGFVFSAVAGLVVMAFYQVAYPINVMVLGTETDYAIWITYLLWAAVVLPAWVQRPGNRWPSVLGGTVGLVLGFFVRLPGAATSPDIAYTHTITDTAITAATLAVVTLGGTIITATLAAALARRSNVVAVVAAIVVVGAVLASLWQGAYLVVLTHIDFQDLLVDRYLAVNIGRYGLPRHAILVAAVALIVFTLARRPDRRVPWQALLITAAAAMAAVVVVAVWPGATEPMTSDDLLPRQQWWVCAVAGCCAAVVQWVRSRQTGALPGALAVALTTALLAGGSLRLITPGPDVFENLRAPVWLVLVIAVSALPVSAVLVAAARASRATAPPPWFTPSIVAVVFVVFVFALVGGKLTPVTAAADDIPRVLQRVAQKQQRPEHDPGRILSQAEADAVVDGYVAAFDATPDPPTEVDWHGVTPTSCAEVLLGHATDEHERPHAAKAVRGMRLRPGNPISMLVTVTSYPQGPPDFSDLADEVAACPTLRIPDDSTDIGFRDASMSAGVPPLLGVPAYRVDMSSRYHSRHDEARARDRWLVRAVVGHTVVEVVVVYDRADIASDSTVADLVSGLSEFVFPALRLL
ncbi:M48 family metalloprotease [Actinokineospora enzanensis]|uniref:M48 family metalloprotease n=1 Tax=Actinokineospora enzanensis TaxID=155975 RepID=UPI00039F6088|nr:M48 family metalloprotease [Actinokineospora enzanensis]